MASSRKIGITAITVAIFVAAGAGQVAAHHGWSEYDNNQTLNIIGKIQNVSYDYPYVSVSWAMEPGRSTSSSRKSDRAFLSCSLDCCNYLWSVERLHLKLKLARLSV